MRRTRGDRPAGRGHLRAVQPRGRGRQPRGGTCHSADHRARQRGRPVVPAVAGRCAATDPLHRARAVVGLECGELVGGYARGDGARSGRCARCAGGRGGHGIAAPDGHAVVAAALVSQGTRTGRGGGRHVRAGLVSVRTSRPLVGPT